MSENETRISAVVCQTIHQMAIAIHAAITDDDLATFHALIQQRRPLVAYVTSMLPRLDNDPTMPQDEADGPLPVDATLASLRMLQQALAEDAAALAAAETWLRGARRQLIHLNRGKQALGSYQAPFEELSMPSQLETRC